MTTQRSWIFIGLLSVICSNTSSEHFLRVAWWVIAFVAFAFSWWSKYD